MPVEPRVVAGAHVEEVPVVGGHVQVGLPRVDNAEEARQVFPQVVLDEHVVVVDLLPRIARKPGQAEPVVALSVANRKQIPLLGVQQKEEPIEQAKGRVVNLIQHLLGGGTLFLFVPVLVESGGQLQKYVVKDALRELLFQLLSLFDGLLEDAFDERLAERGILSKGAAPEKRVEESEGLSRFGRFLARSGGLLQDAFEIELQIRVHRRRDAAGIEAPLVPIGENAPRHLCPLKIPQQLSARRPLARRIALSRSVSFSIEREIPLLRLGQGRGPPKNALPVSVGRLLRRGPVGLGHAEQGVIRFAEALLSLNRFLHDDVPSEHVLQDGADESLFGLLLFRPRQALFFLVVDLSRPRERLVGPLEHVLNVRAISEYIFEVVVRKEALVFDHVRRGVHLLMREKTRSRLSLHFLKRNIWGPAEGEPATSRGRGLRG